MTWEDFIWLSGTHGDMGSNPYKLKKTVITKYKIPRSVLEKYKVKGGTN